MSYYVKVNIITLRALITADQLFLPGSVNLPRDAIAFAIIFFILTPAIFCFEI